MAHFAITGNPQAQEIFSRLLGITAAIQPFSDRKLIVRYEEMPPGGECTPFYHISYPVTILDPRHPLSLCNIFASGGRLRVSATVLTFDPHLRSYQINQYLEDKVKGLIRRAVEEFHSGASVSEADFID